MWIDADIGFNRLDIVSMVVADQDIICGLYPKKAIDWKRVAQAVSDGVPPEELHQPRGSFVVKPIDGTRRYAAADSDGLVEIAAGGTGFMLVKREVFEALPDEVPEYAVDGKVDQGVLHYRHRPRDDQLMSEDYYFCRLARSSWIQGLCGALGAFDSYRAIRVRQPTTTELAGLNPSRSTGSSRPIWCWSRGDDTAAVCCVTGPK